MSRGQENQVNTAAGDDAAKFNTNAQGSYDAAQNDIGNYQAQLAQFAGANPYGTGGAYQTSVNQSTANTADAAGQAAGEGLESAAVRTGQNTGGAIGASEAINEANTRNLLATQANANESRINQGANYGKEALAASEVPATLEANLSGQQANAGNAALGTQQKAAETPSVGEEFFDPALQAAGKAFGAAAVGCWIAAELFGGWEDPRTILFRLWLSEVFSRRWYGPVVLGAYQRWGQQTALRLRQDKKLRACFEWLFGKGLVEAEEWLATADGRLSMARHKWACGEMLPLSDVAEVLRAEQARAFEHASTYRQGVGYGQR
jgi:hypothetical protein